MQLIITFIQVAWGVAGELAPWLFLGLGVAGLLHLFLPSDFIRKHLGTPGWRGIVKASAFGVPLPLCSCGVIPAALGLRKDGASDGASVAFLISTPQTGVDSIMVSAAFLGWPFALFKVVAALVTGMIGGVLVDAGVKSAGKSEKVSDAGCVVVAPVARRSIGESLREFWGFTVVELFGGIWHWLLIGVLVSALLTVVFPQNALADMPWTHGFAGMFVMLLIALPMYVCATASVPIAAALVHAGLPPGAALVFLMAGPASNAATIGVVWRVFGRRATLIYLGVIAVGSMGLGFLFNSLVAPVADSAARAHCMPESMGLVEHVWAGVFAVALFACAMRALCNRFGRKKKCAHCCGG